MQPRTLSEETDQIHESDTMATGGESDLPPAQKPSDLVDFRGLVRAFETGQWTAWQDDNEGHRADLIARAIDCPRRLNELTEAMFPLGFTSGPEFYKQLELLGDNLGFGDSRDRVLGRVWTTAFGRIDQSVREAILISFSAQKSHDLFRLVGALEVVLRDHDLRPAFVADFFASVAERIAGDGAQVVFWKAAKVFCEHHSSSASIALPLLTDTTSQSMLSVASFMLGTLRRLSLSQTERDRVYQFESACRADSASELRAVGVRSWVTTAWQCGVTLPELKSLIANCDLSLAADRDCLIAAVSQIATMDTTSVDVFTASLHWLEGIVGSALSSPAKHAIVEMLRNLVGKPKSATLQSADTSHLLLAVQPIPLKDRATWQNVEMYFVQLLERDIDEFNRVFLRFAENDPGGLNAIIKRPQTFNWLLNVMAKQDVAEIVGTLIASRTAKCRQLGFRLFDRLNIDGIPPSVLKADDNGIRLIFHELQRVLSSGEFITGEAAARICVSLLPRIESAEGALEAEFLHEMFLQSVNLPMSFRGELENRLPESPLVKRVTDRLSKYHTELERAHGSGISKISVPGFARAIKLHQRTLSKQVADSARQHSTILQYAKHVSLLYGNSSGHYVDGTLTQPRPLAEISHSMELPIVSFSDPEGMAFRRWTISQAICELDGGQSVDEPLEAP